MGRDPGRLGGVALDDIDGYRVGRPLGAGSAGAVWLAREQRSGQAVVVRRLPAAAVPSVERFRRDLALAQGLDHRHVVRLLEVRQGARAWLLVSEYAAAGALADLLRRRGPLPTGELVTLLAPIAQALGAAHDAGLTHGHLGSGDILLTGQGRPLLADFGLRLVTAGHDQSLGAADDLVELGRLALAAGGDPAVFTDAVFDGPGAAVADRLLALARPAPIALGFGDGPGARAGGGPPVRAAGSPTGGAGRRRHRFRGRWWDLGRRPAMVAAVVLGVLAVVGLAGVVGVRDVTAHPDAQARERSRDAASASPAAPGSAMTAAGTPTTPAVPAPNTPAGRTPGTAAPATPAVRRPVRPPAHGAHPAIGGNRSVRAWTLTLAALDSLRARAFARLDPTLLDDVYLRDSAPWAADRTLIAVYRSRDVRIEGLRIQVQLIAVVRQDSQTVVLRVVDRFAGATAVFTDGRRRVLPPGMSTARLVALAGAGERWRISGVVLC